MGRLGNSGHRPSTEYTRLVSQLGTLVYRGKPQSMRRPGTLRERVALRLAGGPGEGLQPAALYDFPLSLGSRCRASPSLSRKGRGGLRLRRSSPALDLLVRIEGVAERPVDEVEHPADMRGADGAAAS